jgi:two-component system, OmpR family, sensor histidine kinase CpxA
MFILALAHWVIPPLRVQTLFIKIFVWFWLAMATVSIALIVTTATTSSGTEHHPPKFGPPVTMYADRAANIYERQGVSALSDYITSVKRVAAIDAFFFNERGEEISGRNPAPEVKDLAAQAVRRNDPKPYFSGNVPLVAQSVRTPDRHRYIMVAQIVPWRRDRPGPGPPFPWLGFLGIANTGARALFLRLAAVLAAAGIVCYGLAHYLTAPLVQLRTATQRLSRGDLKARFGKPRGGRHDELTDLGQDFDRMADRIESMMAGQRRLLSDISHELRSPLARINLAAGLIRQRQKAQSDAELDRIELEAKRLDILIGQLLSLTRLESGADRSEKKLMDLSALIKTIVEDADFEAQSRDRTVRISHSDALTVRGNQE